MNIGTIRDFKQKLNDDFVTGIFSKTSDPAFVEIMGSGLLIDGQVSLLQ